MEKIRVDTVIIGSGIAGLSTAKTLAPSQERILVISKGPIKEGATQYAQGGIAAAMQKDDTPQKHFQDTLAAGDGLCSEAAVKILVEEGPERVRALIEMGANFDKAGDRLSFTQEAAHSKRRILHAGDATGREIEKTLGNTLRQEKTVEFMPHTTVLKLYVRDGRCYGCWIYKDKQISLVLAKAVVLATGGVGQLFSHTSNPPVATGDGIALAFAAGCNVQDMEFIQFHPTTLYQGDKRPISIFLISEALRGEGAILKNIHGHAFMGSYHADAELAPRDVVARAIYTECQKTKASHVYLDLSEVTVDIAKRFPTIYKRCLDANIDIEKEWIPVAPAAHYMMGGVQTDLWGRTSIEGVYAGGEVACVGIHGANRLASNSLLDGLVFGHRIATHIVDNAAESEMAEWPDETLKWLDINDSVPKKSDIMALRQEIRELMWTNVGIVREEAAMKSALRQLLRRHKAVLRCVPNTPQLAEVQSMLLVSGLILQFALARKESRGSHFRQDYSEKNSELNCIHFQKNRGNAKVSEFYI